MDEELAGLRRRLEALDPGVPPPGPALAGVLVPFVRGANGWSLIFTRRSDELPTHSGEISFPGGRAEPGETAVDAALREAREELGIDPAHVEVLGPLPVFPTRVSNYAVAPWAALVRDASLAPNPAEIAEVIEVPLSVLHAPGTRREQRIIRAGAIFLSPAYDVGGNTIWGVTARIVSDLLALMG